jgi:hypothetical protein
MNADQQMTDGTAGIIDADRQLNLLERCKKSLNIARPQQRNRSREAQEKNKDLAAEISLSTASTWGLHRPAWN